MSRTHGLISILLFTTSLLLGLTALIIESPYLGLGYGFLIIAGTLGISFFYCAKCPVRLTRCSHIIVGPLTRLFPERQSDQYGKLDYTVVIVILLFLIISPQYWLWNNITLLIGFWTTLLLAGLEINRFVCTRCDNTRCIACKKRT